MLPPHSLILAPKGEERKGQIVPTLLSHRTELCDPRLHRLSESQFPLLSSGSNASYFTQMPQKEG